MLALRHQQSVDAGEGNMLSVEVSQVFAVLSSSDCFGLSSFLFRADRDFFWVIVLLM